MGLTRSDLPLHQLLRDKALDEPDRVAIVFGDRSLTFADLNTESNRLAHCLRALGLERGDRLALFTPNCPEFVVGFYAASKLGAIACPLNSSYREREITHQLSDSGSTILIAHAKLWPVLEASRSQLTRLRQIVVVGDCVTPYLPGVTRYQDVIVGQSTDAPLDQIDPDQLVALPYSSGTTGLPKGVMLTHRNLVSNHIQIGTECQLGPAHEVL